MDYDYWIPNAVVLPPMPEATEETPEEELDTPLIDSFPFASRLKSNYIPSEEEVVEIEALLKAPAKELEDMAAEIDRLQAELDAQKKKHGNLQKQFTTCSALVSVPRRLPDDILREMFLRCLPTKNNALMDRDTAPLIFTRICNHWRRVALSTPLLWSTIHIPVTREEMPRRMAQTWPKVVFTEEEAIARAVGRAGFISRWLQRSGAAPLRISFFGSRQISTTPPIFFEKYVETVLPFASRLKSLWLTGANTSYDRLTAVPASDLCCLESLFLDLHHSTPLPSEDFGSWKKCGLLRSPGLRRLSIRPPLQLIKKFEINWSQLTHIALGGGSDHHFAGAFLGLNDVSIILQPCLNLIDCVLSFRPNFYPDTFENVPSVYLPALRRLSIQEHMNVLPLIEKIEAPNLVDVNFQSSVRDANLTLSALIGQTRGTIRKIAIDSVYLTHETFIKCLTNCPELTSLSLKKTSNLGYDYQLANDIPEFPIDDQLLEFLTTEGCPRLEVFNCHFPVDFSFDRFMAFVRSKQDGLNSGLAKLKSISLRHTFPQGAETVPWQLRPEMKEYIDAGLSFKYNYTPLWQSTSGRCFQANDGIPFGFFGNDDDDEIWKWKED
ncbi:hypothetical protein GALMADRAFT_116222 [Galerina marginata CBS 339.88]|uniref:Uncharacterized protein n=1 Tax=Galerina marginata (strain CBS 339.88) TaxID=685588 RepID=A0A067TD94_GALM3|nr:hypothetical protein GALMADRAFT_116222 [Galerina marginata CBS 339.88]